MTKNKLPFSNQFERGHSFNWAGKWTSGKYYMNDTYVTDFVVLDNVVMVCRKNHQSTDAPLFVYDEGRVIDVDSPYWEFVLSAEIESENSVISAEFIANATEEDVEADSNVVLGEPYIKMFFHSGAYVYTPVKDIITQYKVGVPMLTQEMYDELPDVDKPYPYILIPSETDVTEPQEANYLQVLFSAIRSLQAEVTKLRNSFSYGIQSYVGKDTTMSEVVDSYKYLNDDEPLWSIEEDSLSEITEASINFKSSVTIPPFEPQENFEYNGEGYAKINNYVTWSDTASNYLSNEDTKILLYLTLTSLSTNVVLADTTGNSADLQFNVASVAQIGNPNADKWNVCILISREVASDVSSTGTYGKNYVWLSIGSFTSNLIFAEGYYNPLTGTLSKTRYELSVPYTFKTIGFNPGYIYKFNAYSKYQDFSHEVIPSKPNDDDYKYKAAHLAIRSVDSFSILEEIEDELLINELTYVLEEAQLWIKTKNGLKLIGGSSKEDEGMTEQEMLDKLQELGIVYIDDTGLQLSDISDVTFINQNTGKKFKFEVDSEGDLKSTEIPEETLADKIAEATGRGYPISENSDYRGFISKLLAGSNGINPIPTSSIKDLGLKSDRLKIGAVYCPLNTDVKFGCTHGYIELENSSDENIPLDGCYLHFLHQLDDGTLKTDHLLLDGVIPAGGTYLVRCKKFADKETDADVFISVDSYDKEWWVSGELLDTTIKTSGIFAFALTYGSQDGNNVISASTELIYKNQNTDSKAPHNYKWYFIDAIVFNTNPTLANNACWALNAITPKSNTIIKTTFELDPAKQAYQALTTYESSRLRMANLATDVQSLDLAKEYIEFPLTAEKFPVANYTPKSSKEGKNISTDKTKLNQVKPNMVTCSFGINMYTTRTFNWISCGQFDEYVWIRYGASWVRFESYKTGDTTSSVNTYPRRKGFIASINDPIYARITGKFPGDGNVYTSHKCIVEVIESAVVTPTTFTYIVGRADKNGDPDLEHCSDEFTFTLYPTTYKPRIYQTTDQQGFHWIEYQVWGAAANALNEKINADVISDHVMPVLLNTGDMTQNGTRINEWLDYYNAGINLFNHLEQVNCVGNNDLCNTDPDILGTGDDIGKSNGFYFHVFYCYEVDPANAPLITGTDSVTRYVPSLYHLDSSNYRFLVINSEITYENCKNWFKKSKDGMVVNIYTGWPVPSDSSTTITAENFDNSFTSIYTLIYNMLEGASGKNIIAICHEMPFTVITKDGLAPTDAVQRNYRSLSGSGSSLIGSHTNQLNGNDKVGLHWFSRLLEAFGVKLCLGGHKHTYACTFPLCEYYYYENEAKNSLEDGFMPMESTLANDLSVNWIHNDINLSKLPLIDQTSTSNYGFTGDTSHFSPATLVLGLGSNTTKYHPVTYMMCQATGYKLTSNKELPSNYQHFSKVIPLTTEGESGDKPDGNQKYPMFTITDMNGDSYTVKLIRIQNILSASQTFTQQAYGTGTPYFQYAVSVDGNRQCTWSNSETNLISI